MWEMDEPIGPIENGITYIVRPRIAPASSGSRRAFISRGATQLFVGPASPLETEQMKVRSSTRATSPGSERQRYEFGRRTGSSRRNVPCATISAQSRSYSSWEPSHQWTDCGWHCAATASTQAVSSAFVALCAAIADIHVPPSPGARRASHPSPASPCPGCSPIGPAFAPAPSPGWRTDLRIGRGAGPGRRVRPPPGAFTPSRTRPRRRAPGRTRRDRTAGGPRASPPPRSA